MLESDISENEHPEENTNLLRTLDNLANTWDKAIKVLKAVARAHRKNEHTWKYDWDGFTYHECDGCVPWDLTKLLSIQVINCTYSGGKQNTYRVVDIDTVEHFLKTYWGRKSEIETRSRERAKVDPPSFDTIIGYEDVKTLIRKALTRDKPTHFIFVGPPASAKNMFLEEILSMPNSSFLVATSTSRVGILDTLFEEEPDYLIIDEIDKANGRDLAVLNNLMQNGRVKEKKHKKSREINLNTFVFMAANNVKNIYPDLLSRASVLHFREYDNETFIKTVRGVLSKEGINGVIADLVAEQCIKVLHTRDVREAMRIARLVDSTKEVGEIVQVLNRYRKVR